MKLSAVVCAVILLLGALATEEPTEENESETACLADPADSAELSVLSGQNATGHWLAKVRLLHAAGAAGDGAALQPVHLQLQRSAHRRPGGARTVALEATLAGSPTTRSDGSPADGALLDSPFTRCSESKPPQPCPTCPTPQPCPSPCPAPCPACPSPAACPQPAACPACPTCACPAPPKCPSPCPAPIAAPKRIPPGYVLKEGFGYYKYHTVPVTWFQAKAACEREGAHLAIINSKDEATLVLSLFKELGLPERIYHTGIRVGLHDLFQEGVFLTVLGQSIKATGYAEWSPNEPNNAFGGENCVTLSIKGQYNDIRCDWNGTFVCELPQ